MAAIGFNTISLYYTATASAVPSTTNLAYGELALNITDGKLFYKDGIGALQTLAQKGVVTTISGTTNQVVATQAGTGPFTYTLSLPQSIATTSDVRFGSLGIGTPASGVAGEIRATGSVTAFYVSDIKHKENVQPIKDALATVLAIGGKTFDWNEDYIQEHGGEDGYFVRKSDFGFIAQDVQSAFPLAVRTRPEGDLAVDYEKMIALAFSAIAELKKELEVVKYSSR